MVSRITLRKKDRTPETESLREVVEKSEKLRQRLLDLTVDDTEAFNRVMQAFRMSKDQPQSRNRAIQEATMGAAQVPLSTMEATLEVLQLAEKVAKHGNPNALSDVMTAIGASEAAIHGAASNVMVNVASLEDRKVAGTLREKVDGIKQDASQLVQESVRIVESRMPKK